MDINSLTIGEAKTLLALFSNQEKQTETAIHSELLGKICVVRTYSAGVHIGKVKQISETEVLLENSKRLWKWSGAFTLNEVATKGVDLANSRISESVPLILISQKIEIIPVSAEAMYIYE